MLTGGDALGVAIEPHRVNKQDLVFRTAEVTGMSRKAAARAVATIFDEIARALKRGDRVAVAGVGTFEVRETARTVRDPRTRRALKINVSKTAAFKPAKAFRNAL